MPKKSKQEENSLIISLSVFIVLAFILVIGNNDDFTKKYHTSTIHEPQQEPAITLTVTPTRIPTQPPIL